MGLKNDALVTFTKAWFDGTPVNAVKATGTLTFSGVVSDAETVTIGSNVYEFDNDSSITSGNISVAMGSYLPQATGTLTFTGDVSDGETVTIGSDVFEFDTNSMGTRYFNSRSFRSLITKCVISSLIDFRMM